MPATLSFAEHGELIGSSATVLRANAGSLAMSSPVPTCPGWSVKDLVVHQGAVYRWACAIVRGVPLEASGAVYAAAESAGHGATDPLDWLDNGLVAVLHELGSAPADLDVFFFLKDAPRRREAWARRQAHETVIHAVDAMTARLGRTVRADEVWYGSETAIDGIDELLMGFAPRRSSALRTDQPMTVLVRSDEGPSWTIALSQQAPVVVPGPPEGSADATLSGPAVALQLALWNRGDDVRCEGADILSQWREQMQVTYS